MEFDNDDIVRVAMLGVAFDGAPGDEAKAIKARFDAEVARLDSCSNILVLVAERLLNGRPASLLRHRAGLLPGRAFRRGGHRGQFGTRLYRGALRPADGNGRTPAQVGPPRRGK